MYAIVKVGGKQYRVEEGDSLVVDRLRAEEGAKIDLEPLLLVGDDTIFDRAELPKVKVQARVGGHERGRKLRVQKFKPKRGYRRTMGHRSALTRLEIEQVKLLSRKPAAKKEAAAEADAQPAPKKPASAKEAAPKAEVARKADAPATEKGAPKRRASAKANAGKGKAGAGAERAGEGRSKAGAKRSTASTAKKRPAKGSATKPKPKGGQTDGS